MFVSSGLAETAGAEFVVRGMPFERALRVCGWQLLDQSTLQGTVVSAAGEPPTPTSVTGDPWAENSHIPVPGDLAEWTLLILKGGSVLPVEVDGNKATLTGNPTWADGEEYEAQ